MKKLFVIILSYFVIACKVITTTEQSEDKKINSFIKQQISIVKSKEKPVNISKESQSDTTFAFEKSVDLLEKITGIHAEKQQTYLATKIVDDKLIDKWSDWLNKNRGMLIWETNKNRINRKDKDIYSGLLLPHSIK
jgi:uncharacterized protein YxeA